MLVTLPDGVLQSRSKPAMSDNVKINVFWYLHTEVLIRRQDVWVMPGFFASFRRETVIIKKESSK